MRGQEPPTVEIHHGEYLFEAINLLRWHGSGPMGGITPLTFGEVHDFAKATQRISEPWEIEAIVTMSRGYCWGLNHGKKIHAMSPMVIDGLSAERAD